MAYFTLIAYFNSHVKSSLVIFDLYLDLTNKSVHLEKQTYKPKLFQMYIKVFPMVELNINF